VLYRTQKSTKIIKLKVPVVNTLFLSKNQTQLNTTMRNHQYHHSSKKASGVTIFLYLNITLSVWKSEGWNIAWSDKKKVFQYIFHQNTPTTTCTGFLTCLMFYTKYILFTCNPSKRLISNTSLLFRNQTFIRNSPSATKTEPPCSR